tara:strand:+ start:164 stop:1147 length:984 start_codon:yes stop_codon:yes gene_type:complete
MTDISNNINNEFFIEIKKHNSFHKLSNSKQEELENLFVKTLNDAKYGKWLINKKEIIIEDIPFAKGTFSTIHDCKWRGLNIAVKCPIYKNIINLIDLLNEIQIWNTLRHPNLVQFMGFSYENDNLYILMEKINGTDLKDYLNNRTASNNIYKNKEFITQLINSFKFLHNCDPPVIYRDLKPENILIDKIENNIKLTDFGLSKYFIDENNENYKMTGMTGTLRYMAPEVYLNQKYDLKVDIYSIGLIMYYIFTNEQPFSTYNSDNMKYYMNMKHIVFSTSKIKNIKLRNIIDKCIDKCPTNRYNIDELHSEWTNFISLNETKSKCTIL